MRECANHAFSLEIQEQVDSSLATRRSRNSVGRQVQNHLFNLNEILPELIGITSANYIIQVELLKSALKRSPAPCASEMLQFNVSKLLQTPLHSLVRGSRLSLIHVSMLIRNPDVYYIITRETGPNMFQTTIITCTFNELIAKMYCLHLQSTIKFELVGGDASRHSPLGPPLDVVPNHTSKTLSMKT